jgi:glycerol-3-phosphate dehydrogenase (NAD(P)+)
LCAAAVADLAKRLNVDMPITSSMCDVLSGQITAHEAVQRLMGREPKTEH